jgi:hypothetical protein
MTAQYMAALMKSLLPPPSSSNAGSIRKQSVLLFLLRQAGKLRVEGSFG